MEGDHDLRQWQPRGICPAGKQVRPSRRCPRAGVAGRVDSQQERITGCVSSVCWATSLRLVHDIQMSRQPGSAGDFDCGAVHTCAHSHDSAVSTRRPAVPRRRGTEDTRVRPNCPLHLSAYGIAIPHTTFAQSRITSAFTATEFPFGRFVETRQDERLSQSFRSLHTVAARVEPLAAQTCRVRYPQHLVQDNAGVLGRPAMRIGAMDGFVCMAQVFALIP